MPVEVGNLSEGWQYEVINDPTVGLNVGARPEVLQPGEVVDIENIFFRQKKAIIDTGYIPFATNSVLGTPRATFQFFLSDGTSELLLVTNTTLYKHAATPDEWQFVQGPQATTVAVAVIATATTVEVADSTGFVDTDRIGIILDDGTMHMTTVSGAPAGNVITVADAFPSAAGIGNSVVEPPALAGTDDEALSLAVFTPLDWFVFTNGVDQPQYYDGTSCQDIPNLPSSGNTICKAVGVIDEYLLLLNTSEGGTDHPQRVRWPDTGDPTNWSTGNAGFRDLVQTEDFVTAFEILGPYGIVYKERSITRMEAVNTADRVFAFNEGIISAEGAASPDHVINLGDSHIVHGNSNLFEYKGSFDYVPIGDKIFYRIFGVEGRMQAQYKHRSFSFYVEELDEVWFFYVSVDSVSNWCDELLRYNLSEESFTVRKFALEFSGYGFHSISNDLTWNDLVGDWLSQSFSWGSSRLLTNSPVTHLLDPVGKSVYTYNYTAGDDNGTSITFLYETQDYFNPHNQLRVDEFEFKALGGSVLVEYSTDTGETWNTMGTVSLTEVPKRYKLNKQFLGDTIRFRFSGTAGGFELYWYAFLYSIESND